MAERPEVPPPFDRSSSFARSFFNSGQDLGDPLDAAATENGEEVPPAAAAAAAAAAAGGGGQRRRQSRRASRGGRSSGQDTGILEAAQAAQYEEGEPTQNLPHLGGNTDGKPDRQSSWYTDALAQGGGAEDLSSILGQDFDAAAKASQPEDISPDDEVLEQYRIMAHVEANIRVKDNTGFDMAEYEKRRKMQPEATKGDYYSGNKKPKPRLPEPRLVAGGGSMQKPEEPPLPPPRPNRRFLEQRAPAVPELSPGIAVRGQTRVPDGDHVVRCLGCKVQLRVSILATLVSCPDCMTVSPASSTRR